ncbi:MAG: MotA/TolQ/ExbB proton channel family protein, partial [Planctomycetota bacterium]
MPDRVKPENWKTFLIILFAIALVLSAPLARAADDTEGGGEEAAKTARRDETEEAESMSVLEVINAGGFIGYIIIFLFLISVALTIEHALTIRRGVIMPPELLADVEECFEREEYEEAIMVCEEQPTFFSNVVAAGLSRVNAGYKQMEEAMSEAGEEAAVDVQQKISYLALIANIAPMLGLLGTVLGMIKAFAAISNPNVPPKPADLAGDIQLALVTTFLGLVVAIPVMCVYQFFKNRVQKIVLEVGAISGELMARFRP